MCYIRALWQAEWVASPFLPVKVTFTHTVSIPIKFALTGTMGFELIVPIKRSVTIGTMINFDGNSDGHGLGGGTCKQAIKFIAKSDWKPSRHSHSGHHPRVDPRDPRNAHPFLVQILSISCSFWHTFFQKKIACPPPFSPWLRIPLLAILDPPLILKQQIKLRSILSLSGLWQAPFMANIITHIA